MKNEKYLKLWADGKPVWVKQCGRWDKLDPPLMCVSIPNFLSDAEFSSLDPDFIGIERGDVFSALSRLQAGNKRLLVMAVLPTTRDTPFLFKDITGKNDTFYLRNHLQLGNKIDPDTLQPNWEQFEEKSTTVSEVVQDHNAQLKGKVKDLEKANESIREEYLIRGEVLQDAKNKIKDLELGKEGLEARLKHSIRNANGLNQEIKEDLQESIELNNKLASEIKSLNGRLAEHITKVKYLEESVQKIGVSNQIIRSHTRSRTLQELLNKVNTNLPHRCDTIARRTYEEITSVIQQEIEEI